MRRRRGWRSPAVLAALGVLAALVVIVVVVFFVGLGGQEAPNEAETPAPEPTTGPVACSTPTETVTSANELEAALASAAPGAAIRLADGIYEGNFTGSGQGTADQPIELCGSPDAILDGGTFEDGYVMHLDRASYWVLQGFTVQNGQKGVMVDATTNSVIRNLTVHTMGDEAIHLRQFSTDNEVTGNTISDTGKRKPKFGEGIYIGSAESNWCDISNCEPDRSDRNLVADNTISGTTSENVDIKEGTSSGILRGNTLDGSSITDADSWVDVKGNEWLIEGNVGANSPGDGFQTHEIIDGWGTDNVFRDNTATVNGPGVGFSLTPVRDNVVECSNKTSDAEGGSSNVTCLSG